MEMSAEGIKLLKDLEGLRLIPYRDSAGWLTVGYGHKMGPGEKVADYDGFTERDAEALLFDDIAPKEVGVLRLVGSEITQCQFDALVCFAYNLGVAALAGSTLLRQFRMGNIQAAANQFLVWDKAHIDGVLVEIPGLLHRRERERAMFLGVST